MPESKSGLGEREELIKQQAEIEGKLDELLKEKMVALSKIRDLVKERSELEQGLDKVNEGEGKLQGEMESLKHKIRDISRDTEKAGAGEEALAIHKRKTELIRERADVEEKLDDVTREKLGLLDKIKELTKKRFELEETLDKTEAREVELRRNISDLRKTTKDFIDSMSREIMGIDSGEKMTPSKPGEQPEEKLGEGAGEHPEEKLEGKPEGGLEEKLEEKRKSLFGVFGKQKKAHEMGADEKVVMLKKALDIMDNLLDKLPEDVIDDFSRSEDFNAYERFYDIVKGYKGEAGQREYIDKNVKNILTTINNLLKKLPEDVVDDFSRSKDFDIYTKVLDIYAIE
jgi:chromosome segregation ATPase